MTGQHRFTAANYRASDEERTSARVVADDQGISLNVLIRASLRAAVHDQTRMFRLLRPHIAAIVKETPRGRPRPKKATD